MCDGSDFWTMIRTRRSIRRFSDQEVPDDVLKQVVEAATWAPSSHNKQTWEFIVTRDKDKLAALSERRFSRFLKGCPAAIVVLAPEHRSPRAQFLFTQNAAAATENLLLAARALGLATCWIGDFDDKQVHDLFQVPPEYRTMAVVAVGYPQTEEDFRDPFGRRPLEEVLHWEKF
ncbi:MAG TPA: nitroreductase family protein [Firmicutes bacterium]|nr:nitroreductase family protein [Candidatus Fermentithermobacillaceae bacterium]